MTPSLEPEDYDVLLREALAEDLDDGDCTTESLIPPETLGGATMLFKENGVLAGAEVASEVFRRLDSSCNPKFARRDGDRIEAGEIVARIDGRLWALLAGERTALNFVQRLSGIATLTRQYADVLEGTGSEVFDTRKTLPGWRRLAKHAVRMGGGRNHRLGLYDQVLIKDNHLQVICSIHQCTLPEAVSISVTKARESSPGLKVEVEVEDTACFEAAVNAQADIIMLDNRSPSEMERMVRWLDEQCPRGQGPRPVLEASGGISLSTVRAVAETGVDMISVGALTHSAPALDVSMEFQQLG